MVPVDRPSLAEELLTHGQLAADLPVCADVVSRRVLHLLHNSEDWIRTTGGLVINGIS